MTNTPKAPSPADDRKPLAAPRNLSRGAARPHCSDIGIAANLSVDAKGAAKPQRRNAAKADAAPLRPTRDMALNAATTAEESEAAQARAGLAVDRLFLEVARGAFFDPRKVFDADGNPLPLDELDADTASAIASLDVVTTKRGGEDGTVTVVRTYRFVNRFQYLDAGLKLHNAYRPARAAVGVGAVNALTEMLGSMRSSALPVVAQVEDDDDLR